MHLIKRYWHILPLLLFGAVYLPWFGYLQMRDVPYTLIHCTLDDLIPFCEYFVIPYLLWFLYVAATMTVLFFLSQEDFLRLCLYLFPGMIFCLLVYTFFPNGQGLRPDPQRDNFCLRLVRILWAMDPAVNVCPSIHVFNSIGVHIALRRIPAFTQRRWLRAGSLILCTLIILSTVFLKQHSVLDVLAAFALGAVMYFAAFYRSRAKRVVNAH